MEITPWTIYWISRLDSISILATVFAIFSGVVSFAFLSVIIIAKFYDYDNRNTPIRVAGMILKRIVTIFMILFSLALFLPSTKEMCAIIIIPKIANSEKIQNIGNEFYELALDWMKELKPQNIKKD